MTICFMLRRCLRRSLVAGALSAMLAAPAISVAQSADYPAKPIRFVVAFPAGSATDQTARVIAQHISQATGHGVVVDNRGGANGFIASETVAKAAPDGYTVLVTTGTTHSANPNLFRRLPYDPVRDFTPVSSLIIASFVMVVGPTSPANSVGEFVKLVSSQPGKLSFASGNAPSRIGGEMFKQMSKADLIHVPYKGAPQALTDLMGGQVSVMWTDIITGMPLVKGGKVKALAVTSQARLPIAPAIPTMKEQGFPDYELINGQGMYLPANTPPSITARLTALVHAAIRAEQTTLEATGAQILPLSNTEFAALQARDTAMWASVVKAAGMTPE